MIMDLNWVQTSKNLVFKNFLFDIYRVGFRSPRSEKEGQFDVLESKDWVNIIPVTSNGNVIMVKQFRCGSSEVTLEFPAGAIKTGETPLDVAKRELEEETGSLGHNFIELGKCRPNPAFLTNTCWHFLAEKVEIKKMQNLDEYEEIELAEFSITQIDQMIKEGSINHSLSITAWYFYKSLKQ